MPHAQTSPTHPDADRLPEFHLEVDDYDFYATLPEDATPAEFLAMERAATLLGYEALSPDEVPLDYLDDGTVRIYLVPREDAEA